MGQIKLTPTGFKYYEYDREDPQFAHLKNGFSKGKYLIIEKDTGKTVASYDSDLHRDDYWYVEKPLPHLLTCLKDVFKVEPGATYNDFLLALQEETFYGVIDKSIAARLQYGYWNYQGDHIPNILTIRQHADTSTGFFQLVPETNGPTPVYYGDLPLTVDPNLELFGIPVNCEFTFLEAIHSLLGLYPGQIRVQKNGFYDENGVAKVDPMEHLMHYCEFEPDVTLLDIFNMVGNHGLLKQFLSIYSNAPHINAYHRAAREKPHESIDLHYLEVSEVGEIYHKKKYSSFEFGNPDFHGIGPLDPSEAEYYDEHPEKKRPATSSMAIEFYHPSVIAHLPIRLTTEYRIWNYGQGREEVFVGKKKFTLLEALDAIYDEVTFFGLPSNAADKLAEIREQIDGIKEKLFEETDEEDN